ncbi:hypothetical protein [Dietzia sp. 179-F 9C3 NHS]|uniref:hypothetical protein n=1 Tax=Dietzia sp. 179-F 9C3 NHS TaxID=3374295 RepID=UPI00387A46DB
MGRLARTAQGEGRFREAAFLSASAGALMVQGRHPDERSDDGYVVEGTVLRLEPAAQPAATVQDDLTALLRQAVRHGLDAGEFVCLEVGGWDTEPVPFCMFGVIDTPEGRMSVVETAPDPEGTEFWDAHVVPGRPSQSLSAPADEGTIDVAPILMLDAASRWGLEPWDLALTFVGRSGEAPRARADPR